jgi:cell division protein FtsL
MDTWEFEYPVRKVIANRPIAHEIDKVRQRELWQWVVTGLLLAAILLFWVVERSQIVSRGYEIEEMQQDLVKLQEINRQLRLDVERLRSPKRIEDLATRWLHLVPPGPEDAVILQRVVSPPPPPASVIVARQPGR